MESRLTALNQVYLLPESENKYSFFDNSTGYQVVRPPCARADIRTWEYITGKGGHRATAVENYWPLYESALSVEVKPAPARHSFFLPAANPVQPELLQPR